MRRKQWSNRVDETLEIGTTIASTRQKFSVPLTVIDKRTSAHPYAYKVRSDHAEFWLTEDNWSRFRVVGYPNAKLPI